MKKKLVVDTNESKKCELRNHGREANEVFATDKTRIVKKLFIDERNQVNIIKEILWVKCKEFALKFDDLHKSIDERQTSSRFILFKNFDGFYNTENKTFYSEIIKAYDNVASVNIKENAEKYANHKIENLSFNIPTLQELKDTFGYNMWSPLANPYSKYVMYYGKGYSSILSKEKNGEYRYFNEREYNYLLEGHRTVLLILVARSSSKYNIINLLESALVPKNLLAEDAKLFSDMSKQFTTLIKYIKTNESGINFDVSNFYQDVITGIFSGELGEFSFDYEEMLKKLRTGMQVCHNVEGLKKDLLQCDFKRANISPYTERQINDLNLGHWELHEMQAPKASSVEICVEFNDNLIARPPQMDVVRNGVCGIDFGTKSTVVACFRNEARLLRVGEGDFTKAPVLTDYENPTAIEFRDFSGFCQKYAERIGRPFTEWEQVTVSHQAAEAIFREKDKDAQYSVFSELKQWVIDKKRRLLLCDGKNRTFEIKPYCEIEDGDFDPIEIYAYYLGLYINNMNNGIYLHYVLSFPVNYELEVRTRLLKSFEKGLKKALPQSILNDSEVIKKFKIYAGASEPAAYAITALNKFNLQPQDVGEKVCYGVFDFGGGTTDFDFGIEEIPEDFRNKYTITQFGNGGDAYLGGENILLLLAYEVYKDNLATMRKYQIPFVLPPKGEIFSGAETLIFNRGEGSQHAYLNSRRLAEKMRPIWERHEGYEEIFGNESSDIKMYSNSGAIFEVQLKVNLDKLEQCIQSHIESGIENFFVALRKAFKDKDIALPIHIFLAGNSSKSPVVKKLFDKHIKEEEESMAKILLEKTGEAKATNQCFKLYLPLGVENANNKKDSNITVNINNDVAGEFDYDRIHTGKTGVVFGLLRSRKGAKDVKIINMNNDQHNEVQFKYLLGINNHKDCFTTVIGLGVPYGQWEKFVWADEEDFELYYTSQPKALEGNMPSSKVARVFCSIDEDEVSDEKNIFIRKIAPDKIQYAVGTVEEFLNFNEETFEQKIYTQILNE